MDISESNGISEFKKNILTQLRMHDCVHTFPFILEYNKFCTVLKQTENV